MRKFLNISLLFVLAGAGFFILAEKTEAAGFVPCGGYGEPACQFCDFFVMFNNIVKFVMLKLAPLVAALMLVIGGVMFLSAGAKPEMLNQAKGVITSVVIGLVIIFTAWVIVNTVLTKSDIVAPTSGLLKWYDIGCSSQ